MADDNDNDNGNGFYQYKRLILAEIDELKASKRNMEKCIIDLRLEIADLRSKLWVHIALTSGAAAGGAGIVQFLFGK